MTDSTTKTPLRVKASGLGTASIDVPVSQLDELRGLLDRHRFRYWVSEMYLSYDGSPEEALVIFGHGVDVAAVQAALDSVP